MVSLFSLSWGLNTGPCSFHYTFVLSLRITCLHHLPILKLIAFFAAHKCTRAHTRTHVHTRTHSTGTHMYMHTHIHTRMRKRLLLLIMLPMTFPTISFPSLCPKVGCFFPPPIFKFFSPVSDRLLSLSISSHHFSYCSFYT